MSAATSPVRRSGHPRSARRALWELLTAAGWSDEDIEDAILLASELVTNAVRHGGGVRRLELQVDDRTLLLAVTDDSPQEPKRPEGGPTEHGGRGLDIIEGLSDEWGVVPSPNGGKQVWSRITR